MIFYGRAHAGVARRDDLAIGLQGERSDLRVGRTDGCDDDPRGAETGVEGSVRVVANDRKAPANAVVRVSRRHQFAVRLDRNRRRLRIQANRRYDQARRAERRIERPRRQRRRWRLSGRSPTAADERQRRC